MEQHIWDFYLNNTATFATRTISYSRLHFSKLEMNKHEIHRQNLSMWPLVFPFLFNGGLFRDLSPDSFITAPHSNFKGENAWFVESNEQLLNCDLVMDIIFLFTIFCYTSLRNLIIFHLLRWGVLWLRSFNLTIGLMVPLPRITRRI